ncbi:MAG: Smr/MutS family protein [Thermodesulfobacteriota bacterium]|nr:Smr/MutS family protein [Thermodesulfobacteriota bacterium]
MPRKRKKQKTTQNGAPREKRSGLFNPAFAELVSLKRETPSNDEVKDKKTAQEKIPSQETDENEYFIEAMSDVVPFSRGKTRVTPSPDPDLRPAHTTKNDELEVIAQLTDLVNGAAEMDISFSDEYIEGAVQGFDKRLMTKLKKGLFPVQDYLDLHGLTKAEAETKIRDFLLQSYRVGLRCVLIVHGRGLNSESHIPVLKERLPIWLKRGPVKKIILAFSTAMPYDGGTGAIYVLLRKEKAMGI